MCPLLSVPGSHSQSLGALCSGLRAGGFGERDGHADEGDSPAVGLRCLRRAAGSRSADHAQAIPPRPCCRDHPEN